MEYEDVALRPGMVPALARLQIQALVDGLCLLARHQKVFFTWRPFLADSGDDMVLELALASGVTHIITHNLKDFRGSESLGIRVITPQEALSMI